MLLCRSGLFRPLRSPAYEGTLVSSGVSSRTKDQVEKYLGSLDLEERMEMSLVTSVLVHSLWTRRGAWYLVLRKVPMEVLGTGV